MARKEQNKSGGRVPRQGGSSKGELAEELLTTYFRNAGYFAVRGVPVLHQKLEVTDIDLWLYLRTTTGSRERVNVDAKNRAKPKAMERIFWALGIRDAYGLDKCIVATTDKKGAVRSLGDTHGVLVLDGDFLSRLKSSGLDPSRLTDDQLQVALDRNGMDKLMGGWRQHYRQMKSRFLNKLDFDGCNEWLDDFRYFSNAVCETNQRELPLRLTYFSMAGFLISVDFCLRRIAFLDKTLRAKELEEGFRYGSKGAEQMASALDLASSVAAVGGSADRVQLRNQLEQELESIRADILADFFARPESGKQTYQWAKEFEKLSFQKPIAEPASTATEIKSLLGLVLDFCDVSRTSFFSP